MFWVRVQKLQGFQDTRQTMKTRKVWTQEQRQQINERLKYWGAEKTQDKKKN